MTHVALVFDNTLRPETTGGHCLRALQRLTTVTQVLPSDLSRLRDESFDCVLRIDDGLDYELPALDVPLVSWAIDTHLDFPRLARTAESAALVFCAQQDGVSLFQNAGKTARWLPLACDPELHRSHGLPKEYDVAFVGNRFPGPREDYLALIEREFPRSFLGTAFFEELARIYSKAHIGFNRSVGNDINMRVFEVMSCGGLLLSNDLGSRPAPQPISSTRSADDETSLSTSGLANSKYAVDFAGASVSTGAAASDVGKDAMASSTCCMRWR